MGSIIALDVGDRRVGVAIAHEVARLPRPLTTLEREPDFWDQLEKLLANESANMIVVGMPRNLSGNDTAQSAATRGFIQTLSAHTDLPVETIDEAVTSKQAEQELVARGKAFSKADIDALAAVYILEDYLRN